MAINAVTVFINLVSDINITKGLIDNSSVFFFLVSCYERRWVRYSPCRLQHGNVSRCACLHCSSVEVCVDYYFVKFLTHVRMGTICQCYPVFALWYFALIWPCLSDMFVFEYQSSSLQLPR